MGNEPRWFNFIMLIFRIVLALVLFVLILWSYFRLPRYGNTTFIVILCLILLAYLRLDIIRELDIPWLLKLKTRGHSPVLSKEQRDKIIAESKRPFEGDAEIQLVLAKRELNSLISNYSFFYGRLHGDSDIIRFSDAYSGRPLRYINHFSQDMNGYLYDYSKYLKKPLLQAVKALKEYIDHVCKYQKKEEKLSQPAFQVQKYTGLLNDIVTNSGKENFQVPA